jgi:hypothetical protein
MTRRRPGATSSTVSAPAGERRHTRPTPAVKYQISSTVRCRTGLLVVPAGSRTSTRLACLASVTSRVISEPSGAIASGMRLQKSDAPAAGVLHLAASLGPMQKPLKLAVGALGGLVVAVGVVVITASAAGVNLTALHSSSAPATPAPASASKPSPATARATPNPAARAVNQAVVQAEAQALGVQPKELQKDLHQGLTLHQVADQKGVSQADFQSRFEADLKTILDQDVKQGTLTAQQEQQALTRLGRRGPAWDAVPGKRAQASPSPSASPSAT